MQIIKSSKKGGGGGVVNLVADIPAWRINESLYWYFWVVTIIIDEVTIALPLQSSLTTSVRSDGKKKKTAKKCTAHSEFLFCLCSCFCCHSGSADLASSNTNFGKHATKSTSAHTHAKAYSWTCFISQLYYTWLYILSSDLYVGEQTKTWQTNHKHCRVWLLFPEPADHHL